MTAARLMEVELKDVRVKGWASFFLGEGRGFEIALGVPGRGVSSIACTIGVAEEVDRQDGEGSRVVFVKKHAEFGDLGAAPCLRAHRHRDDAPVSSGRGHY